MRNTFTKALKRVSFEWDHTKEEHETIWSIKQFIETNFKWHQILQDLNYEVNSYENKVAGSQEL
jgi:hypothetical protein